MSVEISIIGNSFDIIEAKFIDYIMEKWVNVVIYNATQKNEIVKFAKEIGFKNKMKNHTFESIVDYLKHCCDFESFEIIFDELELDEKAYESLIIYVDFNDFE